jgi:hypothetical protein
MSVIKAITSTPETVVVIAETGLRAELPKDAALFVLAGLLQMYEAGEFDTIDLNDTHKTVIETNCARIAEKAVYV